MIQHRRPGENFSSGRATFKTNLILNPDYYSLILSPETGLACNVTAQRRNFANPQKIQKQKGFFIVITYERRRIVH